MEYEEWVAEVQSFLRNDYELPEDSFLMQPHDGTPALRSWMEMFQRGTPPEQMAEWTFHIF
jgi:hypothetical protein